MFLIFLLRLEVTIINITAIVNKIIYLKRKQKIKNFHENILPGKYLEA